MKFSDLPPCSCFVVISPDIFSLVLAKDSKGNIRKYSNYIKEEIPEITGDTEVQPIIMKFPVS